MTNGGAATPRPLDLFDATRHEPLNAPPWSESRARAAVARIVDAAHAEFDADIGGWRLHPQDDPPAPGAHAANLYWGATGVIWALQHLASRGLVPAPRDWRPVIETLPDRVHAEAAHEEHGTASYLFGDSAPLLLAWQATRRADLADRLFAVVQGNLHNPVHEPLWGNAGTVLAAIHMAGQCDDARWPALVRQAVNALHDDMVTDPDTGTWTWQQDLYGHRTRYLGAGHGLAGNAFAALRASAWADASTLQAIDQRSFDTLNAVVLRVPSPAGSQADLVNWHALTDRDRIDTWLASGRRPLVQDCHGAPGVVCRLARHAPGPAWDALLRAAGEFTWHAGPLVKGPSICHGTAGSALACLKLWRRFGDALWLQRARALALHAAQQVETARAAHGMGRHSLWTGDLGVACVLASALDASDDFPTLDVF